MHRNIYCYKIKEFGKLLGLFELLGKSFGDLGIVSQKGGEKFLEDIDLCHDLLPDFLIVLRKFRINRTYGLADVPVIGNNNLLGNSNEALILFHAKKSCAHLAFNENA